MIPARLVWPFLEADHPFTILLSSLRPDDSCSPIPDILEMATEKRYFIAFTSENGNARLNKFQAILKDAKNSGVRLLNSRYGEKTSSCVVYLDNNNLLTGTPTVHRPYQLTLLPPSDKRTDSDETAPVDIPGCVQMPTY